MINISLREVASGADGEISILGGEAFISGVSIDSREVKSGELYVALKGERFDGHSFIKGAIEKGAAGIMAAKDMKEMVLAQAGNVPVIFVEDTLIGMGRLAEWYRSRFDIKVVAVTGSSGKTTTKDMISSVLSKGSITHKTEGNYNNLVGLPLTIFGLNEKHETAVLEMGMDRLGEIRELSKIGKPDIAVITNIGIAHMENLGSRDNIFKAKTEIFEGLKPFGVAVVNGDDEYFSSFKKDGLKIIKYGFSENCDYRCTKSVNNADGSQVFTMTGPNYGIELKLMIPGKHNIHNAMAAAVCGILLGMKVEDIYEGVLSFKPSKLRMEFFLGVKEARIINDTYNANPDSMKAALEVLREVSGKNKYVVVGDMLELGEGKELAHLEILRYIKAKGCGNAVLAYGELFGGAAKAWNSATEEIASKKEEFQVEWFESKEEIVQNLRDRLEKDDLVLIKGSRGMRMEQVADGLRK